MSEHRQWTRREVVRWLGLLGFMGSGPALRGLARIGSSRPGGETLLGLLDQLEHIESAAIVGREYLRLRPDENSEHRLTELVLANWTGRPAAPRGGQGIRKYVRAERRLDFELGRTVRIDGWVLSQTEARLCGLAALRG